MKKRIHCIKYMLCILTVATFIGSGFAQLTVADDSRFEVELPEEKTMDYNELLKDAILIILTAMIAYIFAFPKLRHERNSFHKNEINIHITNSLIAIRQLFYSLGTIEILGDYNTSIFSDNPMLNQVVYPDFMSDYETMMAFCNSVSEARKEYELYLDINTAAYLYSLERFLMNIGGLAKKINCNNLALLGVVLFIDLRKVQCIVDQHIVKCLNKSHYRLYSLYGKKWEKAKQVAFKKVFSNTEAERMFLWINGREEEGEELISAYVLHRGMEINNTEK